MTQIDTDIVPLELRTRLTSHDAGVRRIALIELAEEQDESHLPWLIAGLSDTDAELRAEAARRLAGWETPEVVAALGAALRDGEETVRLAAAQSLSELKSTEAAPWLLPLAEESDGFVRAAGLRALRELRSAAASAPALASLLHTDAAVRREAVGVLGWLKQREALPELAHLATSDPDSDVRRAATGALGLADAAQNPTAEAALVKALHDPAWAVREEAAVTLGKLKLAGAVPDLIAALDDEYWQVRLKATRALGQLRATTAIAAVGQLLGQQAISNLRKEAAIALGEIGDPATLSFLESAEVDPDPEVRKLARLARIKLTGGE